MSDYILHNYFRSTTSVRVRIALAIKGLDYDYKSYALLGREHKSKNYLKLNPQGLVPALETEDGKIITQSLAILEFLEETHPCPPLLPADIYGRARVRSLSQIIALDVHPLGNLRVLQYLETEFGADQKEKQKWFIKWSKAGMQALETRLQEQETGKFCHGDEPTMADICLYSQMFNNERFGLDMDDFPTIKRINQACQNIEAFAKSAPMQQIDAKT